MMMPLNQAMRSRHLFSGIAERPGGNEQQCAKNEISVVLET